MANKPEEGEKASERLHVRQELIPWNDFAAILQKQQQASGGWRIEADALPVPGKRPQLIHIGIKYNG